MTTEEEFQFCITVLSVLTYFLSTFIEKKSNVQKIFLCINQK